MDCNTEEDSVEKLRDKECPEQSGSNARSRSFNVPPRMSRRMLARVAPSASRMPISL